MKIQSALILIMLWFTPGCKIKKESTRSQEPHSSIQIQSTPYGGQSSQMNGQVEDFSSGEKMPFAKVVLQGSDQKIMGAMTDENGKFSFNNVPNGEYQLIITYVGYDKLETFLKINKPKNYDVSVKLFSKPEVVLKPIIYLYPTHKQDITVKLNYRGQLSHSYPAYPAEGWRVVADPNGTLWDTKGQEYYALFWEGVPDRMIAPKTGFVIAGKETAAFLEEKLAYLGLNRREANEFIMFWLPQMENNPYNFIHFAGQSYEEQAELMVHPKPETSIRVMMLTQALNSNIKIPLQDLSPLKKARKGFTLVEWGGSVIHSMNENI
ncbi:MAG: carboxypeptidase-like regulatory domain-containing protein [Chitinophagaceae bacterium]|nr:carboxypeptidase-like regulatory domain-containing protein [Chitinophagaceae bacterium]